ncbi:MAG: hypothetical protein Q4F79_10095 [Eubacteriales bacterium]|nr:hypothetical protein [Eubacteriales bacterium]
MSEWKEKVENYLQQQEEIHAADFAVKRNVVQSGYAFSMSASYRNDDPRYMLGIKGALENDNLCSEYCFFADCEELTAEKLDWYFTAGNEIRDALTEQGQSGHQFTMIGLVLCTENFPKNLHRKVRRHSDIKRYKKTGTGWSEVRICVVDLADGMIYANADGDALKRRLTQGVPQQKPSLWAKLLGRA